MLLLFSLSQQRAKCKWNPQRFVLCPFQCFLLYCDMTGSPVQYLDQWRCNDDTEVYISNQQICYNLHSLNTMNCEHQQARSTASITPHRTVLLCQLEKVTDVQPWITASESDQSCVSLSSQHCVSPGPQCSPPPLQSMTVAQHSTPYFTNQPRLPMLQNRTAN